MRGAGAPAFLKHVPLVGGALRGICVRAVKRMVEASRRPWIIGMPDTLLPKALLKFCRSCVFHTKHARSVRIQQMSCVIFATLGYEQHWQQPQEN